MVLVMPVGIASLSLIIAGAAATSPKRHIQMNLPADIMSQVFALPADQRYELAQRLLESIDDPASVEFDEPVLAELLRRREEMLRGEQIVPDWRALLTSIESSLDKERHD
jgi:putative addiction module component (TIGR02574 family)